MALGYIDRECPMGMAWCLSVSVCICCWGQLNGHSIILVKCFSTIVSLFHLAFRGKVRGGNFLLVKTNFGTSSSFACLVGFLCVHALFVFVRVCEYVCITL